MQNTQQKLGVAFSYLERNNQIVVKGYAAFESLSMLKKENTKGLPLCQKWYIKR